MADLVTFKLEVICEFVVPKGNDRAIDDAAASARDKGVEALQESVRGHGFALVHTAYGAKRVDG